VPDYAGMALNMDPIASQDPEYLAFMRGAGYSEAEVLAELARKQGSMKRQLARAQPRFADELRQAEKGVETDFTNRGLYRSGNRMVEQVDAGNRVRRDQLEFNSGISDQMGDLSSAAMRDIAEGRRQAMDMALTSRQTAAINAANATPGGPGAYPTVSGASGPAPASRPLPQSNPFSGPAGRKSYDQFRRRTTTGRPGTRGPVAY
jgi:hypothetical protein